MASIHKTRAGKYELRWREGSQNRSRTFPTKLDAEEERVKIERRGYGPKPVSEIPSLYDLWKEWCPTRTMTARTATFYEQLLKAHVWPEFRNSKVSDLDPPKLMEWQRRRLDEGAGPTALGKAQMLLGQMLDYAVLPCGYIESNPVSYLPKPVRDKKERRWLTAGDVEAIRFWYLDRGDHGSATLVSVLAYVGIRPQEALALEWDDLGEGLAVTKKVVDGEVIAGSKMGRGHERRVFVPEMVKADLHSWREQTTSTSPLIFPNKRGEPWTSNQFRAWRERRQTKEGITTKSKCFKLAAEEVGLGWGLTPYALRHTAATLFVAAGRSHTWVAHQLGHSPAVSLNTYQHLYAREHEAGRTEDDFIREARGFAPRSEFVRSGGE